MDLWPQFVKPKHITKLFQLDVLPSKAEVGGGGVVFYHFTNLLNFEVLGHFLKAK